MCTLTAVAALLVTATTALGQRPERRPAEPIPISPEPLAPAEPAAPAPLEIELDSSGPWLFEPMGLWGFTVDHYNRIDGLTPGWGFRLEPVEPTRTPSLVARIAVPTTRHRLYWRLAASQRLPLPGALVLRAEHFQRAATFDDWKVSTRENDVSSFVAASDLLDWWREKGTTVALDAETPDGRFLGSLSFLAARQRSERNRAPFALFGGDEDWRDNPPIQEGRLRALILEARFDTRDVQSPLLPFPGWSIRGTWEGAGGPLGGDLDFSRASLDVRRYTRIGRDAWWDWRVVWMGALADDDVPSQRRVKLGGPGSLRGFRTATFVGDAGIQAQSEVRLPLPVTEKIAIAFLSWHWVGFIDAGAVAAEDRWGRVHASVGTGISGVNILTYVGVFLAQRITDFDGDEIRPRLIVRLRRDF